MTGAQHVESVLTLVEKSTPQVQRKIRIDAAESGDEMILECANGTFGSITPVASWWDQLKVNFLVGEKFL